jgi:hypothetical protein
MKKLKLYLDTCCYNRPFDDQTQDKIHVETECIIAILHRCEQDEWDLYGSDILENELSNNLNIDKQRSTKLLYRIADYIIELNDTIVDRALEFEKIGLKSYDSLHLASAEYINIDVFLTTDIKFIKNALKANTTVKVMNPVNFIMEVLENE